MFYSLYMIESNILITKIVIISSHENKTALSPFYYKTYFW